MLELIYWILFIIFAFLTFEFVRLITRLNKAKENIRIYEIEDISNNILKVAIIQNSIVILMELISIIK